MKVFLHVSKDEQAQAASRSGSTTRRSAGSSGAADLDVHKRYDDYMAAYEDAIAETSTDWAPWHVVPADHNWVKALAVAELLVARARAHGPASSRSPTQRSAPADHVGL